MYDLIKMWMGIFNDVLMNLLCFDCRSMTVGGVTFPLEQQSKDPQSVVYTGQYDTEGVAHTKSGERQPVQINIQVRILNILYTGQEANWGSQHRMETLFVDVGILFLFLFCSNLSWFDLHLIWTFFSWKLQLVADDHFLFSGFAFTITTKQKKTKTDTTDV